MEFIKDKQKAIELLNELISSFGDLKVVAKSIDTILFDWVDALMRSNECGGDWQAETLANVKAVRDMLNEIEHS